MTKILAIIGARLNSSRLAGKHLLPLACDAAGNTLPIIGHILRRLKTCSTISAIELATTADEFNQPLINWAQENQLACVPFEGDVNDLMGRLDRIIQRQQPDYIVYICGDCPLIDPNFIDHALTALMASNKDSIKLRDNVSSIHEGMAFYSQRGWKKLMTASQCDMSREHVGYADKLTPVLDYLSIDDSADYSRIKHRISVDTPADFRFMAEVYLRWYVHHGAESIVSLQWVQQQLLDDPALAAINTHVQQKAADKQYPKVSLYCHVDSVIGMGHLKRCALIAEALQEQLGLGTKLHVIGSPYELPWLHTKVQWFDGEVELFNCIKQDNNPLLILDFHPDFIDTLALENACHHAKLQGRALLALDKLTALVESVDKLFIPSFYCSIKHPNISYGWQNYLFSPITLLPKKPQVMILTGGTDALDYGRYLPNLLEDTINPHWDYLWIRGPLAKAPEIKSDSKIKVLHNPSNLPQLQAESTIILSCYGLSLFESIAARAATILLPVKHLCENAELDALAAYQCCQISNTLPEAVSQLMILQNQPEVRNQLINKAGTVFADIKGMSKLLSIVSELLTTANRH